MIKKILLDETNDEVFIAYSGHGVKEDGSWEFYDGYLEPKEVYDIIADSSQHNKNLGEVAIHCDSCYSGRWLDNLDDYKHVKPKILVNCAVAGDKKANGTEYGGLFT